MTVYLLHAGKWADCHPDLVGVFATLNDAMDAHPSPRESWAPSWKPGYWVLPQGPITGQIERRTVGAAQ